MIEIFLLDFEVGLIKVLELSQSKQCAHDRPHIAPYHLALYDTTYKTILGRP